MSPIIYRGYEIRDCEARMYIPKHYPMLEIVNLSDCDANMLHADTIEEAKLMIDEKIEDENTD